MSDDLVGHMTKLIAVGLDRIEQLTAERDAAYAQGYSDAETEISESALGQRNDFLRSQYDNAKLRIEALTVDRAEARAGWHKYEGAWMAAEGKLADVEAERDRLQEALEQIEIACDEEVCVRTAGMSEAALGKSRILPLLQIPRNIARAALKGETP